VCADHVRWRTNLSNDVVNEVRKFFPNQVFQAVIPRTVRLAEAPSYGQPISAYAPNSTERRLIRPWRVSLRRDGLKVPVLAS